MHGQITGFGPLDPNSENVGIIQVPRLLLRRR
jgi:hypothetical protein